MKMVCVKVVGLLALGVMIGIELCTVVAATSDDDDIVCEAKRQEYWSVNKERCVKCRDCPAKKGRNVTDSSTQIRTGEHGALNCFPCKYCPTKHFAKANQCHKCNLDKCQKLHRKVLKECNIGGDVVCSPICQDGYHSQNGETDYYFPCAPNLLPTTTLPVTTRFPQPVITSSSAVDVKIIVTKSNMTSRLPSYQSSIPEEIKNPENDSKTSPVLIIVCVALPLIVFVLLGVVYKSTPLSRRKDKEYSPSSSATTSNGSMHYDFSQDIEEDCGHSKYSIMKIKDDNRNAQDVRAELQRQTTSPTEPRPELTREHPTQGPVCFCFKNDSMHKEDKCMFKKEICHCVYKEHCSQCCHVNKDIIVGVEHLLIVKTNVCHHPEGVFRRLNIPDATVYSLNDDRERDPENITQSEYIYKVLENWLRTQGVNAKLNDLISALCKERFHDINSKLLENYLKRQTHAHSLSQTNRESQAKSSLNDDASIYLKSI